MSTNPFLVSVRDLVNKPGQLRRHKVEFPLRERWGSDVAFINEGEIFELDMRIESVHEGILATGVVFADGDGACSRCLEPLLLDVEVDFQELFAYSVDNEDDFAVEDEQINLEQVIRDAVVLSLPFQPVCSEDCLGLCANCGVKMAENPHHVHEAVIDSRWSALEKLKEE